MSKSNFTCVAWFSDVTKALEYTADPQDDYRPHLKVVKGDEFPEWVGCRISKGRIVMYNAVFEDSVLDFDTVIEKVNSSTVGEGWAVWVRKPKPEWTEWKTFIPSPLPSREYRMGIDGSVEYRDKKNV